MEKNQYFIVNLNEIKKVLKEENNIELKLDIDLFNKLDKEYRKIIIVVPFFSLSKGGLYEIVSNYKLGIKNIITDNKNKVKLIECIGYEKVSLLFKTLYNKIEEKEVYEFFKSLEDNNLMDTYKESINYLFYGGLSDEIYFNKNKQLQKIRRKYE